MEKANLSEVELLKAIEDQLQYKFGSKGQRVVDDNMRVVKRGFDEVHEVKNKVLGATVNGTTYCGMRARTTGAPQNHWFGPSGDPRGAGIGTPEAIRIT